MIIEGLNKLKTAENPLNNETNLCRSHVAFLLKALTECLRNAEHLFEPSLAIQVACLASEATDIIIQSQA